MRLLLRDEVTSPDWQVPQRALLADPESGACAALAVDSEGTVHVFQPQVRAGVHPGRRSS